MPFDSTNAAPSSPRQFDGVGVGEVVAVLLGVRVGVGVGAVVDAAVGDAVAVGGGDDVAVGVGVMLAVGLVVMVAVAVAVNVRIRLGLGDGDGVAVGSGVGDGLGVAVFVAVDCDEADRTSPTSAVGISVGSSVAGGVAILVGLAVTDGVKAGLGAAVRVRVEVTVGEGVAGTVVEWGGSCAVFVDRGWGDVVGDPVATADVASMAGLACGKTFADVDSGDVTATGVRFGVPSEAGDPEETGVATIGDAAAVTVVLGGVVAGASTRVGSIDRSPPPAIRPTAKPTAIATNSERITMMTAVRCISSPVPTHRASRC